MPIAGTDLRAAHVNLSLVGKPRARLTLARWARAAWRKKSRSWPRCSAWTWCALSDCTCRRLRPLNGAAYSVQSLASWPDWWTCVQFELGEGIPAMVKAADNVVPVVEPSNEVIAARLEEIAQLLAGQGGNPFRVGAYRTAAESVRQLVQPAVRILDDEGVEGLLQIRGVGQSIAGAIAQLVRSGKISLLQQLRGEHAPKRIFTTVAGVGPKTAARIHDELGLDSLGELQAAAWDGRLARMPGMGTKRLQAIREALAGRSAQAAQTPRRQQPIERGEKPTVAELLDIDRDYRRRAAEDRLPRIAPRRFNDEGKAWLPIMHVERDGRHYTAMYSNTARAHEFGATHDWVVIYRDDKDGERQWTVITSTLGKLRGQRIVRGREAECAAYYQAVGPARP